MNIAYPVRATAVVAFSASLALFGGGLLLGYSSFEELPAFLRDTSAASSVGAGTEGSPWSFGAILLRNLGAIALMYAGVASAGILSAITLASVSLYVGATAKIGVLTSGAGALASDVALYAPIEFLGCLVAAAAGLYPTVSAFSPTQQVAHGGPLRSYLHAVPHSLLLFGLASVLILFGAGLETLTLTLQGR